MKIYTKTGDTGDTALFGGGRVGKEDVRVEAYGQVDELNAVMGMARAAGLGALDAMANTIQDHLLVLGAVLATPQGTKADKFIPHLRAEWVAAMETSIDELDQELAPLTSFILPGGSGAAAMLHYARTVCRRAERRVVPLMRAGKVTNDTVVFLNRLSDLLFTMARAANARAGVKETVWTAPKA